MNNKHLREKSYKENKKESRTVIRLFGKLRYPVCLINMTQGNKHFNYTGIIITKNIDGASYADPKR